MTDADGNTLLSDDFSGDASQWTHTGSGSWTVQGGQYVETSDTAENTMVSAGDTAWHDYDLHVKATRKSGKEGFLVAFGVKDTGTYYWWNIGGWNNTQTAVEQAVDGGKSTLIAKAGSVETGRTYDVGIKVRGGRSPSPSTGRSGAASPTTSRPSRSGRSSPRTARPAT